MKNIIVSDPLAWALVLVSIIGIILNVLKDRNCFMVWMVTNSAWAMIDFYKGIPQQGFLFLVYFVLAVWGYASWQD